MLAGDGISTELFVIYRAVPAAGLAPETVVAARERRIDAAFHFFRHAPPRRWRSGPRRPGYRRVFRHVEHLCFSANVAAPLTAAGWPTRIAAKPTEDGLFDLLAR
ncbi:hypothetical protein ACFSKM_05795 [Ancylobacter dichloromethanicus]